MFPECFQVLGTMWEKDLHLCQCAEPRPPRWACRPPHCSVQHGLLASPLVGFAKQSNWYLVGEVVCGRANAGVEKPWERYR